jgi:hypothetical protein
VWGSKNHPVKFHGFFKYGGVIANNGRRNDIIGQVRSSSVSSPPAVSVLLAALALVCASRGSLT